MEETAPLLPHHTPKLWTGEAELGALHPAGPGYSQDGAAATERGVWRHRRRPGPADQQRRVKRHLLPDPGSALRPRGPRVPQHAQPDGPWAGDLCEQPGGPHQHLPTAVPLAVWGLQGVAAGGKRHHGISKEEHRIAQGNIGC